MSQPSQCTIQMVDSVWKSFFEGIKDWSKNPHKYSNKPRLPKYLDKDGRYIWCIKNNCSYIEDNQIKFFVKRINDIGHKFYTKAKGRLIQIKFIPKGSCYIMEVITEIEKSPLKEFNNRVASIDLGINNFVTLTNNIGIQPIVINGKGIKSYNQHFNKRVAHYKSLAKTNNNLNWTKRLEQLYRDRRNKMDYYMHKASRYIANWCVDNNIDTLVVGYNKEWKQESNLCKSANQNFHFIPYNSLIEKLQYKCENIGINFIITEESYTSGTSFLDNELPIKENYNKSRRIKRGLFKSNKDRLINSDVNGSYQIMKKVFPNMFDKNTDGIKDIALYPIMIDCFN